jgi:beta-glucosidase
MTVQLYRQKYQQAQGGRISMVLSGHWGLPVDVSSPGDVEAAHTYVEWQIGWMADPLYTGEPAHAWRCMPACCPATRQGFGMPS